MTLRHLKIFISVCETGSMTATAKLLYLSQPSVSLAISELEAYYGIRLFDRIAKRLHITESGRQFLQYATHIGVLFDDLEKGVRNFDNTGILKVGASITVGTYFLPGVVKEFEQSHPAMKVSAMIGNSGNIEDQIMNNSIDVAIIEGIAHNPYIIQRDIRDDRLVLICGPGHRFASKHEVEIADILEERLILREKGSAGREIVDGMFLSQGLEIEPLWVSISTQAILSAVKEGLGISVLPYLFVQDSLERGELKTTRIKDVTLDRKFSIITHRNKFLTQSMQDFIQICCSKG
ncbi:MAG: LysR family transcriptional regulator [Saccharofermentanales bacterium]